MLAEGLCLDDLVGVGVLFAQKRVRASETFTVQFDSGLWELRTSFEGGLFFSQVRWTKGKTLAASPVDLQSTRAAAGFSSTALDSDTCRVAGMSACLSGCTVNMSGSQRQGMIESAQPICARGNVARWYLDKAGQRVEQRGYANALSALKWTRTGHGVAWLGRSQAFPKHTFCVAGIWSGCCYLLLCWLLAQK